MTCSWWAPDQQGWLPPSTGHRRGWTWSSSRTSPSGARPALTWRDHVLERDLRLDAAGLFLMIGADPCTTWLHEVGVELDAKGFVVTRDGFLTSVPGVFAVGDVRAGSVKRVVSAVSEGSVVISAVHSYLAGTKTS